MRCRTFIALAIATALTACSLAPHYEPPKIDSAAVYKEAGAWQQATPSDREQRGEWWRDYGDAKLDELETSINSANPDLAAAADRFLQARALANEARTSFFPTLGVNALATHNRQSDHRPLRSASQPANYQDNLLGAGLGYEFDLWGRVRNTVAAGRAAAQAVAADLESLRLSLHAELAGSYIALRGLDAEQKLLADTVETYDRALRMTQTRHDGGIASGLDVSRAQTQLDTARAQLTDIAARRALYEHAIASLIGVSASQFTLPPAVVDFRAPNIPVGVPSELLQRRPDIAGAERRMAGFNAEIGVARAAYFPRITLTALGGYENTGGEGWLNAPNRFWSIGPQAIFTLFDAGRRSAEVERSRAALDESVNRYRSVVLLAFQQVEDSLASLTLYRQETQEQEAATQAAERTLELAMNRYREGVVNYLEVVTAQTAALQADRALLDLRTRQLQTSVGLIRALGGGWTPEQLPKSDLLLTAQP